MWNEIHHLLNGMDKMDMVDVADVEDGVNLAAVV